MVEIAREEIEEDERSQRVFRGDLASEIARMALRKFRDSIGILGRVVGIR